MSQPEFLRLHYGDAGSYSCKVSIPGLTVKKSVELVVEGERMFASCSFSCFSDASELDYNFKTESN